VSVLSSFIGKAAPIVAQFAPLAGGAGTAVGLVAGAKVQSDARKERQEQLLKAEKQRRNNMAFGDPMANVVLPTARPSSIGTQPGFFDRLGGIATNVGDTLLTGLESAVPSLLNRAVFGQRPQTAAQGPAITTVTNVGAQESQGSGSIQSAGMGGLLPSVLGGARSLLKSPLGQIALGGGAGLALQGMGSQSGMPRITRRMKSDARRILNMTGGNLQAAADMFGVSQEFFVFVLLKKFRNDGPVVTKAALRKTKQTVRRLKSMCDMYDSLRPTATRRKAPMKRATSTTLIKN